MTDRMSTPADAGAAARRAIDVASDKQAADVVLLDVRGVCGFTDYMVVLTAGSVRQLRTLAEDLAHAIKGTGLAPHHQEGTAESGWVLLDFGDLIVHLFSEAQRDFYRIEQVWRAGRELVRLQ